MFATWGTMTLVWQHGLGHRGAVSADPTGSVAFWVPFMVFAFIYGLSMDYEVFILARMREEYDRTGVRPTGPWWAASPTPAGWSPAPR